MIRVEVCFKPYVPSAKPFIIEGNYECTLDGDEPATLNVEADRVDEPSFTFNFNEIAYYTVAKI